MDRAGDAEGFSERSFQLKRASVSADIQGDALAEDLMETTCIQLIRVANREFRDFIEEVSRTGVGIAEHPLASRRLARIAMRLEQVGNLLGQRGRISGQAADFRWCLAEYVETLRRLRTALETIQYSLLVEGAHLENLRAHLQAARDWVATLRETS